MHYSEIICKLYDIKNCIMCIKKTRNRPIMQHKLRQLAAKQFCSVSDALLVLLQHNVTDITCSTSCSEDKYSLVSICM